MIIFKIYIPEKVRNKPKASKNFSRCIQYDSSKNLHSGKVLSNIKEKFQFFGIKESLKIASKTFFFEKIPNQDLHYQENHKSFDLFINRGTYQNEIR